MDKAKYQRKNAGQHSERQINNPLEWVINKALDILERQVERGVDAVAKAVATAWQKRKDR